MSTGGGVAMPRAMDDFTIIPMIWPIWPRDRGLVQLDWASIGPHCELEGIRRTRSVMANGRKLQDHSSYHNNGTGEDSTLSFL